MGVRPSNNLNQIKHLDDKSDQNTPQVKSDINIYIKSYLLQDKYFNEQFNRFPFSPLYSIKHLKDFLEKRMLYKSYKSFLFPDLSITSFESSKDKDRLEDLRANINLIYKNKTDLFYKNESNVERTFIELNEFVNKHFYSKCVSKNNFEDISSILNTNFESLNNNNVNEKEETITGDFFNDIFYFKSYFETKSKERNQLIFINKLVEEKSKVNHNSSIDQAHDCGKTLFSDEQKVLYTLTIQYHSVFEKLISCYDVLVKNEFKQNDSNEVLTVFNQCMFNWRKEHSLYTTRYINSLNKLINLYY